MNNYTGMVGIGTTTPASKLHVNGSITASSFVSSGGTSSQYLMADGSTSSLRSGPLKLYETNWGDMMTIGVLSHSIQLAFALSVSSPPSSSELMMSMDILGVRCLRPVGILKICPWTAL